MYLNFQRKKKKFEQIDRMLDEMEQSHLETSDFHSGARVTKYKLSQKIENVGLESQKMSTLIPENDRRSERASDSGSVSRDEDSPPKRSVFGSQKEVWE